MRARKLNAEEREQLRRQRSEARLIIARCKERNFEYVVNPPVIPKLVFGTTMHREVLPTSGPFLSSFMRSMQPEGGESPGPMDYEVGTAIGFKYPSAAGFSALASKTPRLGEQHDLGVPPIGAYAPENWRPTNRSGYTFRKEFDRVPKWMTPAPPDYSYHIGYPDYPLEMCFGSCRKIWPAVAVFCSTHNTAQCYICKKHITGDYFHNFNSNQDMCRLCMKNALATMKHCSLQVVERYRQRKELNQFVPARYCSFFHDHNGTSTATQLISFKELRDKIRVENYLYRFAAKPH